MSDDARPNDGDNDSHDTDSTSNDRNNQGDDNTRYVTAKDWRSFKKAVEERAEFKTQLESTRQELADLRATLNKDDVESQLKAKDKEIERLQSEHDATKGELEKMVRANARSTFMANAMDGIHPDHKNEMELIVEGLLTRGELEYEPDDAARAGHEARKRLAKDFPAKFGADDESNVTVNRATSRNERKRKGDGKSLIDRVSNATW